MVQDVVSRRHFFRNLALGSAGASILELASRRAAWAQAAAPGAPTDLFDIQNVADGVYLAVSKMGAVTNCNSVIFVNAADVLVVDAQSKPSAPAALIAQIQKQVTTKPVRYLVDSHFHWDHTQGNAAYPRAFGKNFKIISSEATKKLIAQFGQARFRETLDPQGHPFSGMPHIPVMLDAARKQLSTADSTEQKAALTERIRQLEAFQQEMQNFTPALPTVTFTKTYVIKDKAHDLHVEFHGRAHTAGDVMVFCPQKRVVAIGDLLTGFMADCYPKEWPATIDSVMKLDFNFICGGHGGLTQGQQGRDRMLLFRNFVEQLAERVESGKKAGKQLAEIQQGITPESIKGYMGEGGLMGGRRGSPAAMQAGLNTNIEHVYNQLGKN
jgi:cyclase